MESSVSFCVKWDAFEANTSSCFNELRENSEFFDVTLCCDNGIDIIPAHKVILAACSPLFRKILSRQKNPQNPFLYLKGIHMQELQAILDFMYCGEVNVAQDSLNEFLEVAKELAIKGINSNPMGSKKLAPKRKSTLDPGFSLIKPTRKPKLTTMETLIEDTNIKAELDPSCLESGDGQGTKMDDTYDDMNEIDHDNSSTFGDEEKFGLHRDVKYFDDTISKFSF